MMDGKITLMDFSLINDMDNNHLNTHFLCQTRGSNRSFDLFLSLSVGTPSMQGRSFLYFLESTEDCTSLRRNSANHPHTLTGSQVTGVLSRSSWLMAPPSTSLWEL